ncbi:pyridoxamine 5'-phosphate oxidase family protein [Streptomyces spectabilis]|uniref:Pyridoxamine 5'-phosphate oxidase family protein n=1 Tax=Streptomyces spectabilis TaxID=68270 RepID=A0A516R1B9_STRST|nr:pyridoxamine 5'-phosphate oxidase family protein [Streptomyces spectabilis]QDQ09453.1 pyridoxamine 5'-phosphate oxidase family protein [Streptomyces spectabilis]
MSSLPAARRLVEVSGAEALYLLEGSRTGRLVYVHKGTAALRPAAHLLAYGRLVVRTPVPETALPDRIGVTYHVDDIRTAIGTGWSVSASGPVEFVSDPDELAHYRRTLPGWTHGPHDTLLRISPQTVSGFRLARAEA